MLPPLQSLYALLYAIFITSAVCYSLITWSSKHLFPSILTAFWPLQVHQQSWYQTLCEGLVPGLVHQQSRYQTLCEGLVPGLVHQLYGSPSSACNTSVLQAVKTVGRMAWRQGGRFTSISPQFKPLSLQEVLFPQMMPIFQGVPHVHIPKSGRDMNEDLSSIQCVHFYVVLTWWNW